jgi:copper transport protein
LAVLVATGIYATYAEASLSLSTLLETQYGRLIATKVVVLLAIMPLALLNKTTLVPAVLNASSEASRLLRSYAIRELALVLTVIAVTAWLVLTPPPV